MEESTPETAQEANCLAWVAIWVSLVAVVISAVSVAISLSVKPIQDHKADVVGVSDASAAPRYMPVVAACILF